jgi:hypothetical protein
VIVISAEMQRAPLDRALCFYSRASGSRIRSIRALDLGLAPRSEVCRALVGATDWLAAGRALAGCGPYSHLRADRELGARRPLPKEYDQPGCPLDYSGLRGEGSIPVPLPPPMTRAPRFLPQSIGRKSPRKWGFSRAAAVLEIAELRPFQLGDGIFLRNHCKLLALRMTRAN